MTITAPALSNSGRDVSKRFPVRERLEAVPRVTAEVLDSIFEAAPTPMVYLDCDFNFVRANQAYAAAVGATSAELSGQQYFALFPDVEIQSLFSRVRDRPEHSPVDPIPISYFGSSAHGTVSWDWRLTPMKNSAGAVAGLLLTLWNATIQGRPSQSGIRPQQLLQTLLDEIPVGIYWKDRELRYQGCNARFAADVGVGSVSDLIGKHESELTGSWGAESTGRDGADTKDSATPMVACEELVTTPDGRQIWLHRSEMPLCDETGDMIGMFGFCEDITERKRIDRDLQLTHAAIDKSNTCFYWLSPEGRVISVNDAACSSLGYTHEELVGLHIWDFDPDFTPESQALAWEAIKTRGTFTTKSRHRRKDGTTFPIEVTANHIPFGEEEYSFVFVLDISERTRAYRDLQLAHTAINKSKTCIHWFGAQGRIIDVNDYACEILGYTREEMIGLQMTSFDPDVSPEDIERIGTALKERGSLIFESRHRRKDGMIFPVEVTLNKISFGDEEYTFSFAQDISERKDAEEKIRRLAFFDPLTKLPNRRLLMDRLHLELTASARTQTYGAVLFVDLDNFKNLNDTKGHDVGDLLLLEVSRRLQSTVREGDTVARLGGDEFVMILPALSSNRDYATSMATAIADRALQALCPPCSLRGHEHNASCSIGISLFCGQGEQVENMLSRADTAMYEAKKAGRNTYRLFDPNMQHLLKSRTRHESWMRRASFRRQP